MISIHQVRRPGGKLVLIDFRHIEGRCREWVLDHVWAGQDVFTKEYIANDIS